MTNPSSEYREHMEECAGCGHLRARHISNLYLVEPCDEDGCACLAFESVHVLHDGHALCAFLGPPYISRPWPVGQRFVGIAERDKATCKSCKAKAKEVAHDRHRP